MFKRGIFGGSFDPVHLGHLRIAQTGLAQARLQEIIWLPQASSSRKPGMSALQHRQIMLELALAEYAEFRLVDVSDAVYAVDQLAILEQQYPKTTWYWLVGWDVFLTLPRWRGRSHLIPRCRWLVAPRLEKLDLDQAHGVVNCLTSQGITLHWQMLDMQTLAISSSQIRCLSQQGESIAQLVPPAVEQYIYKHHLYQSQAR